MKQKKYFVSYAYNKGFGNSFFDGDELTKENYEAWIMQVQRKIKEINLEITEKIIILNIQEIK